MILLLGASGLLGKQVLIRLMKNRLPVRVISRGQEDWQTDLAGLKTQGVEVYYASFGDSARLEAAFQNCTAVINTIGSLNAKRSADLAEANLQVVEKMLALASECKVQRILHVGCLGASEKSASEYLKYKWLADQAVKQSPAYWTILRPSYMFGDQFALLKLAKPLIRFPGFLPVFGSGLNLIQPIWVEDVADCVLLSLYDKSAAGQVFELAGPEKFSMTELLEMFRKQIGLFGPSVNLPSNVTASANSYLTKTLPLQLVHTDFVSLLMSDSTSERNDLEIKFGIKGISIREHLEKLAKIVR